MHLAVQQCSKCTTEAQNALWTTTQSNTGALSGANGSVQQSANNPTEAFLNSLDIKPQPCQPFVATGLDPAHEREMVCGAVPTWFVVQTEPQREHRALFAISKEGFRAHLAQRVVRRMRYGKQQVLLEPYFRTYIFACFDLDHDPWGPICRMEGVRRFLTGASGHPVSVKPGTVERLQSLGRAGDGAIDDQAKPMPIYPALAPQTPVKIVDGPFAHPDWVAIAQWSDNERVSVLMTMFGGERVVTMPRGDVVAR